MPEPLAVPVSPASMGDPLPEDRDAAAVELVRRHALLTSAAPPADLKVRVECQMESGDGVRRWVMSTTLNGRVRYEVTYVAAVGEYRLNAYLHYDHVSVHAGKGARDA